MEWGVTRELVWLFSCFNSNFSLPDYFSTRTRFNDPSLGECLASWQREIQETIQRCLDEALNGTNTDSDAGAPGRRSGGGSSSISSSGGGGIGRGRDGGNSSSGGGGGGGGGATSLSSGRSAMDARVEAAQRGGGTWSNEVLDTSGGGTGEEATGDGGISHHGSGGGGHGEAGGGCAPGDEVSNKLAYTLRLARALFDGGLIDRTGWLAWVCRQIDKAPQHRCSCTQSTIAPSRIRFVERPISSV